MRVIMYTRACTRVREYPSHAHLGHGPGMHYKYNYIHGYTWASWATTARPGQGDHAHYGAHVSFGPRDTWFGIRRSSGYYVPIASPSKYSMSNAPLHYNFRGFALQCFLVTKSSKKRTRDK